MSQASCQTLRAPGSLALSTALTIAFLLVGRSLAAKARAFHEQWRRDRFARATRRTLQALDDRTLRDLGFHRSEVTGCPDPTRRQTFIDPFARQTG